MFAETPANPQLDARSTSTSSAPSPGPFTVVDSTFATPIVQQPLDHGVDLVVHSATKGIAGHNDATLGVVAGSGELLDGLWGFAVLHGACASPFDAMNGLRGLRTLPVRIAPAERDRPAPGRGAGGPPGRAPACATRASPSHPQHDLAKRQMALRRLGAGLRPGRRPARRAGASSRACGWPSMATSLGGPETLVVHPANRPTSGLTPDELEAAGIGPGLVRVSVGLEHPDDLIADFAQALTLT